MTGVMIGLAALGMLLCAWSAPNAANRKFTGAYLILSLAHGALLVFFLFAAPNDGGPTAASQIGRFVSTHSVLAWIVAGAVIAWIVAGAVIAVVLARMERVRRASDVRIR